METIVYRTVTDNSHTRVPDFDDRVVSEHASGSLGSAPQSSPLSPALFYPLVSAEEMTMWSYWLPTSITFETAHVTFPSVILSRLNRLHAPAPVLDEFLWAYNVGLFEAYEVMTPERQDLRDPLLLGRVGQQRYRMALWGESLRPARRDCRHCAAEPGRQTTFRQMAEDRHSGQRALWDRLRMVDEQSGSV